MEGNCIFCCIAQGKLPSFKVWESEEHLAFLSIHPINPGHTLVIPKKHSEYIFSMDDSELGNLMISCKPVAQILEKAFRPVTGKVGVMVAGLEVAHTHIHLIPMDSEGDLTFARAQAVSHEELEDNLAKIQAVLKAT